MIKGKFFGKIGTKLGNFGGKIQRLLGKLQKFLPLRAKNFEKVHCKGMIFHGNSLHCKGPILEAKFWAAPMVVLRSSAPPGVNRLKLHQLDINFILFKDRFCNIFI